MPRHALALPILSALLIAVGLAACSPGVDPTGDGGPDAEEAALEDLIVAYGAIVEDCTAEQLGFLSELDPALSATFAIDREDIEAQLRASFEALRESEAIVYHPEQVGPCLDAIEAATCDALSSSPASTACEAIFEGTVAVGGECAADEECAAGHCAGDDDESCGACAAFVEQGESCDDEAAVCGPGLQCGSAGQSLVCEPEEAPLATLEAGDACEPQTGCGQSYSSGLVCVTEGEASTCVPATVVELGGDCELFGQPNATRFCKGALSTTYCDVDLAGGETTGTCVERPSTDETCGGLALCNSFESECLDDVCVALLADGETCDEAPGPGCEIGSSCEEGTCTAEPSFEAEPLPVCGG